MSNIDAIIEHIIDGKMQVDIQNIIKLATYEDCNEISICYRVVRMEFWNKEYI